VVPGRRALTGTATSRLRLLEPQKRLSGERSRVEREIHDAILRLEGDRTFPAARETAPSQPSRAVPAGPKLFRRHGREGQTGLHFSSLQNLCLEEVVRSDFLVVPDALNNPAALDALRLLRREALRFKALHLLRRSRASLGSHLLLLCSGLRLALPLPALPPSLERCSRSPRSPKTFLPAPPFTSSRGARSCKRITPARRLLRFTLSETELASRPPYGGRFPQGLRRRLL
jgi:hypothetical protein